MHEQTSAHFPTLAPKSGVVVADGYGLAISVRRRHLIVADGIGRARRERRFARPTAGFSRLAVLGHTGFVSLEALRWMADVGIAFLQIDRDGRVLATSAGPGLDDPRLRRAQALAGANGTGIEVARSILRDKLAGQASVLTRLPDGERAGAELEACLGRLEVARSRGALLSLEAAAASAYWSAWQAVPARFAHRDRVRVPEHWLSFGMRRSLLTGAPRLASNPANAILNYLYALIEAEARLACLAVGLDPGLGVLHADQKARDSLALDLMEAARPAGDAYVLSLLEGRVFRASDFHETPQGVCRILAPLTHHLAETVPAWTARMAPVAERVAKMLADAPGSRIGRIPTPLTQANRSAGRDGLRRRPRRRTGSELPRLRGACRTCGVVLESDRLYCEECGPERVAELRATFQAAGPAALARLRAEGQDPAARPEVRAKISAAIARRSEEAWEWDRKHGPHPDPELFARVILPRLRTVPLRRLMAVTGLTKGYCAEIRRGLKVPHPRHWEALRRAATNEEDAE